MFKCAFSVTYSMEYVTSEGQVRTEDVEYIFDEYDDGEPDKSVIEDWVMDGYKGVEILKKSEPKLVLRELV